MKLTSSDIVFHILEVQSIKEESIKKDLKCRSDIFVIILFSYMFVYSHEIKASPKKALTNLKKLKKLKK